MSDVANNDQTSEAAARYFSIWKHYEDRIAAVKESFSRTVSLLLGFAVALLAWGAEHGVNWNHEPGGFHNVPLILIIAIGGVGIMTFVIYIANDAAIHIASNMKRANRAASFVPELSSVVKPVKEHGEVSELSLHEALAAVHICRRARLITIFLGVIFAVGIIVALVQLCAGRGH